MADLLLKAGANKEAKNDSYRTPLHHAAEHGHREVADLLLKAGANKEAKNAWGYTPKDVAEGDVRALLS